MSGDFDINDLARKAAAQAALQRDTKQDRVPVGAGVRRAVQNPGAARREADHPTPSAEPLGDELALTRVSGRASYKLAGRRLEQDDWIEVFTNREVGWVRGRFKWSGVRSEAPRLAINVWDPQGLPDDHGQPPFLGTAELALPSGVIARWR